jgi:hypothetical protein
MITEEQKNALIEKGGKEWINGNKHRIYFNNWEEIAGFNINTYKTGNISSASLQGETISNNKANKMLGGKLYFDMVTSKFVCDYFRDETAVEYAIIELEAILDMAVE